MRKLYKNVPVLDSGARGSTTTFVERGIGDVLLAWENEAFLAMKELGAGQVRDRHPFGQHPRRAAGRGGRQGGRQARHPKVAQAYLEYLYTPEGQEIAAQNYYRPTQRSGREEYDKQFPKVTLFHHRASISAAGRRRRRRTLPMAASFDQIYIRPPNEAAMIAAIRPRGRAAMSAPVSRVCA